MSSWFAHAMFGLVLGRSISRHSWLGRGVVVGLSILPDVDMFVPFSEKPRVTHSITFAMMAALLGCIIVRRFSEEMRAITPLRLFALFTIITLSHLLLDVLKGTHGHEPFWPMTSASFEMPFGFLPGSPWPSYPLPWWTMRNLALELLVLGPLFWMSWWRPRSVLCAVLASVSICAMAYSYTLPR